MVEKRASDIDLQEESELAEAIRQSLVDTPTEVGASLIAPAATAAAGAASPAATVADVANLTAGLAALSVAPTQSGRRQHYAVWGIPGRPELSGVWSGPHGRTWEALQRLLPNGRYGQGCRLRGAASLEAAVTLFVEEYRGTRGAEIIVALHLIQ